MPTWNLFDPAVQEERVRLRAARHELSSPVSYKAQALRELAHRLELERRLSEMREQVHAALTRAEAAEGALHV